MKSDAKTIDTAYTARKIESLALIFQASAERGDVPAELFADAFSTIADLATDLRESLDAENN